MTAGTDIAAQSAADTPDALAARKAALRKAVFAARKVAHAAGHETAPGAATAGFLAAGFAEGHEIVAGYRPIRTELDPTPLMEALIAGGKRLCVPVIQGAGQPLLFREWRPGVAMEEGPFGAMIPAEGDWLDPTLLIAPLVAFDAACWRLGYGGGFYDRTLAMLEARRPTVAVGFAYAAQEVDEIPRDATDRPLAAVVRETGIIRREGG